MNFIYWRQVLIFTPHAHNKISSGEAFLLQIQNEDPVFWYTMRLNNL